MFRQWSHYIFSILILLTFTSTSVYGVSCSSNQRSCYSSGYIYTWCCPSYSTCSSELGYCYTTTLTPALISVIIIVPLVICCTLLSCCIRASRRQRVMMHTTNNQPALCAYQQPPCAYQQPRQCAYVGPVYNVGAVPTIHSNYESPPPPYQYPANNYAPKYS